MKDINLKIKLIFIPYLILSLGILIVYTYLHWLLILKMEMFQIDESIIDFWIPVGLILLVLLLFLRKRIKLLNLKVRNGKDATDFYFFIAAVAIFVPTIIAQNYLRTSTGKLSSLASPDQMDVLHLTKYYHFDQVYLDKGVTGLYYYTNTSGKYNSTLNFHACFAIPIMNSPQDTTKHYFNKWYGIEFNDHMSNRKNRSEKEKVFKEFQQSCLEKYGQYNLNQFVYFDQIGQNDLHKGLLEAVKATNNYDHTMEPIILLPINESFEQRNGTKPQWMIGTYLLFSLIWLVMILFPSLYMDKTKEYTAIETN